MAQQVSLLDLPVPWLVQLLLESDADSLLALFMTCKWFMRLVLHHAKAVWLKLQPAVHGESQSLKALHLAHRLGVITRLECTDREALEQRTPSQARCQLVAARTMAVLDAGSFTGMLAMLTHLRLKEVELAAPLPAVLSSSSLPNLTHFYLSFSTINWGQATADSFTGAFTKLKHLSLKDVDSNGPYAAWQEKLTQQIAQLPALRGLALYHCEHMSKVMGEAAFSSVAKQLTYLLVMESKVFEFFHTPVPRAPLAVQLTAIQELVIPEFMVYDRDMPWLLSLPRLEKLQVWGFSPDQSWASQHCTWRVLSCVAFTTEALPLLPLHCNLCFQGAHMCPMVILEVGDEESVAAAVNAAAQSNLPQWCDVHVLGAASCFTGLQPLLAGANHLVLGINNLSISSVDSYVRSRRASQTAINLQLECACVGADADISDITKLISSMPAGSKLDLGWWQVDDEDMLLELCSAANHSITLRLRTGELKAGFKQRINEALQQKGLPGDGIEADKECGIGYLTVQRRIQSAAQPHNQHEALQASGQV